MSFSRYTEIILKNYFAFETAGEVIITTFHIDKYMQCPFSNLVFPCRPTSLYRETHLHINLAEVDLLGGEIFPFLPFNYKDNIEMCSSTNLFN